MPVETVACPECHKKLRVPEELLGKQVKCPTCSHVFTAELGQEPAVPPPTASGPLRTSPSARAGEDDEEERRPARRSRVEDDDDDDDRPRRRSRRDDDDDEDYGRRRRRRRRDYAPHRGGMILAFGIIAFFFLPFVFGPMAWIMGNGDLREIRAGRMDPEGEGMTNAGRICGMVATLISVGTLVICCPIYIIMIAASAHR